tara:strand:- start:14570 stop:28420 length:13851 start_codon:yes stop_codon:yes gene_type:complete
MPTWDEYIQANLPDESPAKKPAASPDSVSSMLAEWNAQASSGSPATATEAGPSVAVDNAETKSTAAGLMSPEHAEFLRVDRLGRNEALAVEVNREFRNKKKAYEAAKYGGPAAWEKTKSPALLKKMREGGHNTQEEYETDMFYRQKELDELQGRIGEFASVHYSPEQKKITASEVLLRHGVDLDLQGLLNNLPWVGSSDDVADGVLLFQAFKNVEDGTETDFDLDFIYQYDREMKADWTTGAKWMNLLTEMAPFMGEMALSAGAVNPGTKLFQKGAKKAGAKLIATKFAGAMAKYFERRGITKLAGKGVKRGLYRLGAKKAPVVATRIAGKIGGSITQLPYASSVRILADTYKNMAVDLQKSSAIDPETGKKYGAPLKITKDDEGKLDVILDREGDNFVEAFAKATGTNLIELFSEHAGRGIGLVVSKVASIVPGSQKIKALKTAAVALFLRKNPTALQLRKFFRSVAKKTAWNGPLEEFGEEEFGKLLRFATRLEKEYTLTTWDEALLQISAFAVLPGAKHAIGYTAEAVTGTGKREAAAAQKAKVEGMTPGYLAGKGKAGLTDAAAAVGNDAIADELDAADSLSGLGEGRADEIREELAGEAAAQSKDVREVLKKAAADAVELKSQKPVALRVSDKPRSRRVQKLLADAKERLGSKSNILVVESDSDEALTAPAFFYTEKDKDGNAVGTPTIAINANLSDAKAVGAFWTHEFTHEIGSTKSGRAFIKDFHNQLVGSKDKPGVARAFMARLGQEAVETRTLAAAQELIGDVDKLTEERTAVLMEELVLHHDFWKHVSGQRGIVVQFVDKLFGFWDRAMGKDPATRRRVQLKKDAIILAGSIEEVELRAANVKNAKDVKKGQPIDPLAAEEGYTEAKDEPPKDPPDDSAPSTGEDKPGPGPSDGSGGVTGDDKPAEKVAEEPTPEGVVSDQPKAQDPAETVDAWVAETPKGHKHHAYRTAVAARFKKLIDWIQKKKKANHEKRGQWKREDGWFGSYGAPIPEHDPKLPRVTQAIDKIIEELRGLGDQGPDILAKRLVDHENHDNYRNAFALKGEPSPPWLITQEQYNKKYLSHLDLQDETKEEAVGSLVNRDIGMDIDEYGELIRRVAVIPGAIQARDELVIEAIRESGVASRAPIEAVKQEPEIQAGILEVAAMMSLNEADIAAAHAAALEFHDENREPTGIGAIDSDDLQKFQDDYEGRVKETDALEGKLRAASDKNNQVEVDSLIRRIDNIDSQIDSLLKKFAFDNDLSKSEIDHLANVTIPSKGSRLSDKEKGDRLIDLADRLESGIDPDLVEIYHTGFKYEGAPPNYDKDFAEKYGLTDEQVESMYEAGYNRYSAKRWYDADAEFNEAVTASRKANADHQAEAQTRSMLRKPGYKDKTYHNSSVFNDAASKTLTLKYTNEINGVVYEYYTTSAKNARGDTAGPFLRVFNIKNDEEVFYGPLPSGGVDATEYESRQPLNLGPDLRVYRGMLDLLRDGKVPDWLKNRIARNAEVDAEAEAELADDAANADAPAELPDIPMVEGRPGKIMLPEGHGYLEVVYVMANVTDLTPSHDARGAANEKVPFKKNEHGDINERPYDHPTEGLPNRRMVFTIIAQPEIGIYTSNTLSANDGPPMGNRHGIVEGGNARTQAAQVVYDNGQKAKTPEDVEIAKNFRDGMIAAASDFGISTSKANEFPHPIIYRLITRVVDKNGVDVEDRDLGYLSGILNAALTSQNTLSAGQVSKSGKISDKTITFISDYLSGTDKNESPTIKVMLADEDMAFRIAEAFKADGAWVSEFSEFVAPDENRPGYDSVKNEGKVNIEKMLFAYVVNDVGLLSSLNTKARNNIETALPELLLARSQSEEITEWLLTAAGSVDSLVTGAKKAGGRVTVLDHFFLQSSITEGVRPPGFQSIGTASFAHGLTQLGPRQFRAAAKHMNQLLGIETKGATAMLAFEDAQKVDDPEEAVRRAFAESLDFPSGDTSFAGDRESRFPSDADRVAALSKPIYEKGEFKALKRKSASYEESINLAPESIRTELAKFKGTSFDRAVRDSLAAMHQLINRAFNKGGDNILLQAGAGGDSTRIKTLLDYVDSFEGLDGLWKYIENTTPLSAAEKVAGGRDWAVNSSLANCAPSKDCATYCYATMGNYNFIASMLKAEIVDTLAKTDPQRLANLIALKYKSQPGWDTKALRMFDKGDFDVQPDGSSKWLEVVDALNKHGIVTQIFSKRPAILSQVDPVNVRLLSIDKSNPWLADGYGNLDIALIYTGAQDKHLLTKFKDNIRVILPVKLTAGRLLNQDEVDAIPPEFRVHVCPIDAGFKQLPSTKKRLHGEGPGEWWCTKCDGKDGTGLGCFFGQRTMANRDAINAMTQTDKFTLDQIGKAISHGEVSEAQKAQFLEQISNIAARLETELADGPGALQSSAGEPGSSQGVGTPTTLTVKGRPAAEAEATPADQEVGKLRRLPGSKPRPLTSKKSGPAGQRDTSFAGDRDSKVMTSLPDVVDGPVAFQGYHGSPKKITQFEDSRRGAFDDPGFLGRGHYFFLDESLAKAGGVVHKATVRMGKPLDADAMKAAPIQKRLHIPDRFYPRRYEITKVHQSSPGEWTVSFWSKDAPEKIIRTISQVMSDSAAKKIGVDITKTIGRQTIEKWNTRSNESDSEISQAHTYFSENFDRLLSSYQKSDTGDTPPYWMARTDAYDAVMRKFGYDGVVRRGGKTGDFANDEIMVKSASQITLEEESATPLDLLGRPMPATQGDTGSLFGPDRGSSQADRIDKKFREGQTRDDGETGTLFAGDRHSLKFKQWFRESKVVRPGTNEPLAVYRGEHGETDRQIHTRLGSISFSGPDTANIYATQPNNWDDVAHSPRGIKAYLRIENPVIESYNDPFIGMQDIIDAVGAEKARLIAEALSDHITETNNWESNFRKYDDVSELLKDKPEALADLYLDAYPIFDNPKFVSWFRTAGFDGAIHGGSGESSEDVEFKVFDLNQIKSVFNENPTESDNISFAGDRQSRNEFERAEQNDIGLYSGLFNAISSMPQETFSPDQLKARLKKPMPGVKPEEIKWTFLYEFLDERTAAKKKVTKEDLLNHLADNAVVIKEIVYSNDELSEADKAKKLGVFTKAETVAKNNLEDARTDAARLMVANGADQDVADAAMMQAKYQGSFGITVLEAQKLEGYDINTIPLAYKAWKRAREERLDFIHGPNTKAKFDDRQFNEPGGTNYREIVIQFNPRAAVLAEIHSKAVSDRNKLMNSKADVDADFYNEQLGLLNKKVATSFEAVTAAGKPANFDGSHFSNVNNKDAPKNVLMHMRVDDRVGPNGEKILFITEMQSDWAKELRKKGALRFEAIDPNESNPDGSDIVWGIGETKEAAMADARTVLNEYSDKSFEGDAIYDRLTMKNKGVPDLPLKKTDAHMRLGMKRMIRLAAEGNYDYIAWTPAWMQTRRYGSQRIDWTHDAKGRLIVGGVKNVKPGYSSDRVQDKDFDTSKEEAIRRTSIQATDRNGRVWGIGDTRQAASDDALANLLKAHQDTAYADQRHGYLNYTSISDMIEISDSMDDDEGIVRTVIEQAYRDDQDDYGDQQWEDHIDAATAKVMKRIRESDKDYGTFLPRKEGMEFAYDQEAGKAADKVAKPFQSERTEMLVVNFPVGWKRNGAPESGEDVEPNNIPALKISKEMGDTVVDDGDTLFAGDRKSLKFKEWFGESKVVDENGEPLKLIHGSETKGISVFRPDDRLSLIYATPSPLYAKKYGDESYELYAKILNPRFVNSRDARASDLYEDAASSSKKPYDGTIAYWQTNDEFTKDEAEKMGLFVDSKGRAWFEIAVESPNQIKSTTNENPTKGSDDIRFAGDRKSRRVDPTADIDKWNRSLDIDKHKAGVRAARHREELLRVAGRRSVGTVLKEAISEGGGRLAARKLDAAMHLFIDLQQAENEERGTPQEQFERFEDDLTDYQKSVFALSQDLPEEIQEIADTIIEENLRLGIRAVENGVIGRNDPDHDAVLANLKQSYSARLWKQPKMSEKENARKFRGLRSLISRFIQKTGRSQHRKLESVLEGWSIGMELEVPGAIGAQQLAHEQVAQVIHDRNLIKAGLASGVFSTKRKDGFLQVYHPNFTTWKYGGHAKEGDVTGEGVYVTPDGTLLIESPMYADAATASYLNNVLRGSVLNDVPLIEVITKYNDILKAQMLFTSGFHHQAFIRSYMLASPGKNPGIFGMSDTIRKAGVDVPLSGYEAGHEAIMSLNPTLMKLVGEGLTLGMRLEYQDEMLREKTIIGKAIDHVPMAREAKNMFLALRDQQIEFLFDKMGPYLKAQAGILEYSSRMANKHVQAQIRNGTLTEKDVLRSVAENMNADFGGLHHRRLGTQPEYQHFKRLLLLAPDWTESNIRLAMHAFKSGERGAAARHMWARVLTRAGLSTIIFNLLMAGLDPDEDFLSMYKKMWDEGKLRALGVDYTPIYKAMGGQREVRKYFTIIGHFSDPIKFVAQDNPKSPWIYPDPIYSLVKSAKHKGSVASKIITEFGTGSDWKGDRFTTLSELTGNDDKGTYTKTTFNKNTGEIHVYGSPKGGKLKGKLTSFDINSTATNMEMLPSFFVHTLIGTSPIQVQNAIGFWSGEMDGWEAITQSLGLATSSTREKKADK